MSKDFFKTKSFKITCIVIAILIGLFLFGGFIYDVFDFFRDELDSIQNMPIKNDWDEMSQFLGLFAWIALLIIAVVCIPIGLILISFSLWLIYKLLRFTVKKINEKRNKNEMSKM